MYLCTSNLYFPAAMPPDQNELPRTDAMPEDWNMPRYRTIGQSIKRNVPNQSLMSLLDLRCQRGWSFNHFGEMSLKVDLPPRNQSKRQDLDSIWKPITMEEITATKLSTNFRQPTLSRVFNLLLWCRNVPPDHTRKENFQNTPV